MKNSDTNMIIGPDPAISTYFARNERQHSIDGVALDVDPDHAHSDREPVRSTMASDGCAGHETETKEIRKQQSATIKWYQCCSTTGDNNNNNSNKYHKIRQRRIVVTMYVISLTLLYADYNLLAPNLSAVAEEFGFTEEERDVKLGGEISLAFFLVGAPASFLIGWLADLDTIPRPPLFAVTLLIGEVACFATYFVGNFPALFVTRTLTGISIGGSLPIVYSVLGDLYQAEGRNAISGVVATATGVGIGVGQALGGFLGPTYGECNLLSVEISMVRL
jgi:hypothetical protein